MPKNVREGTHDLQNLAPFIDQVTKRKTVIEGPLLPLDLAQLRDEFDRYGVLFAEMREQATVHSSKLARLMGKVWSGASRTMNDLLTLNRKLAKDKDEAMRDQKRMTNEAGYAKEAFIVELDQMKLQLTVARAALRDKEALLLSAQKEGSEMSSELSRLRTLIGKFVEGRPNANGHDPKGKIGDKDGGDKAHSPAWIEEMAQERSTDVYYLSDQVDELFAKIAHEGQRQSKFLSDMEVLIASYEPENDEIDANLSSPRSPSIIGGGGGSHHQRRNSKNSHPSHSLVARRGSIGNNSTSSHGSRPTSQGIGGLHRNGSFHEAHSPLPHDKLLDDPIEMMDVNVQTSPQDFEMLKRGVDFGVASIMVTTSDSDSDEDTISNPLEDGEHKGHGHHGHHGSHGHGHHHHHGHNKHTDVHGGLHSSHGTSSATYHGPGSVAIPEAAAGNTSNSLAMSSSISPSAVGGGGAMRRGGLPGLKGMSLPPRIEEALEMPGGHMPVAIRELMSTYPTTMRIPSLKHTLKFCLTLYIDKLRYDERCDKKNLSHLTLPQFVYFSFAKKYGLEEVADNHITQLQLALLHHRHHRRVRLLGLSLGSYDVSAPPKVSCRDFDILLQVLQFLRSYDAFSDEAITKTQGFQIDINKGVAIAAVKSVLGPICPDAAAGLANRVATLPAPSESKNNKACDLDHLLELCLDKWQSLNEIWKKHYEVLFSRHCSFFSVVSEMQFASQGESRDTPDKDAVMLNVDRGKDGAVLKNPQRSHRPLEVAMRMQDPFAARAARAKELVEAILHQEENGGGSLGNDGVDGLDHASSGPSSPNNDDHSSINTSTSTASSHTRSWGEVPNALNKRRPRSPGAGPGKVRSGGASEEVVPLITADGFIDCMATVNPSLKKEDVEKLFQEGIQEGHRRCLESFAHVWRYYEDTDGDGFWHNRWTNQTQWLKPFDPVNFISTDIDQEVFIHICFQARVLETSPFMALVDKDPQELWEDSDSFLAQQEMESAARMAEAEARLKEEQARQLAEAQKIEEMNHDQEGHGQDEEVEKPHGLGKIPSFMTQSSFHTEMDGGSFDGVDSIELERELREGLAFVYVSVSSVHPVPGIAILIFKVSASGGVWGSEELQVAISNERYQR
eukprot:CAMPEP_0114357660 /NCGR_PEP_ID=MMETSP0101-20121206/21750_1 /TAXON_ID=38822 ORGANISM="Pteridomonas danica, Strain PT" /NCGR_SAMPLE_ID=MMETSP0101 /ASSEMBLY_ACC=CAM_ASM_000211 /LENGTH=1126 /DNA_ID=CAMNT_0001500447 /DNA_START=52 /DNA_END=3431 /DNA_ORIENTATION=-